MRALEAAETRLSTWRDDSELARLNRAPVGTPVQLSPRLAAELRGRAATGGGRPEAPSIRGSARWSPPGGCATGGRVPTVEEREQARDAGGLAALELAADGRASRLRPGLRIEEGGWGKGAGLDDAIAALRADGRATAAMLNLGGQVAVYGGASWTVPVADPRDRQRAVVALTLSSGSVATSGNSEHGFERDGVRYGHLLDPRTGAPARDFGSLTVWAPDGARRRLSLEALRPRPGGGARLGAGASGRRGAGAADGRRTPARPGEPGAAGKAETAEPGVGDRIRKLKK